MKAKEEQGRGKGTRKAKPGKATKNEEQGRNSKQSQKPSSEKARNALLWEEEANAKKGTGNENKEPKKKQPDTKTMESKAKGAPLKSNGGSKTNKENKANKTRSPYCIPFICFTRVYRGKPKKPNTVQRYQLSPTLSAEEKE